MSRLDPEEVSRRDCLEMSVKRKLLYCEKHQTLVDLRMFWTRHCYLSRHGGTCEYLVRADEKDILGNRDPS